MVRGSAVSQFDPASLTHGRILWIACNIEIDRIEKEQAECQECSMKREIKHCPSCGKGMGRKVDTSDLPDEIQEEIREAAKMAMAMEEGGE